MSPEIASCGVGRTSIACQCASIRPGISVRPPPAITVVPGSVSIGAVEMRAMMLPLISTFDGAESDVALPSKMRTFWNNVTPAVASGLSCARVAQARLAATSGSAATESLRHSAFIWLPVAEVVEQLQPQIEHTD